MTYKELLQKIGVDDKNILNVYQYGSRVYGTANYNTQSDYDFIIITNEKQPNEQFSDNTINVTFYTPLEFSDKLDAHEISMLECYFLPDHNVWKEQMRFKFKLDLSKLRHSLSQKSSNSFVKAKKKLTVEKDYDLRLGKKSLFHSLRIIRYGIQIAINEKIVDYSECNDLFKEIMDSYDDWEQLFEVYKAQHNAVMTEFRLLAPKD